MASPVPAKSQALHNFPLKSLWSTTSHHHRARRNPASSPPPDSAFRRLSPSFLRPDSASESESENRRSSADQMVYKRLPPPSPLRPESASESETENRRKSPADQMVCNGGSGGKICVKIRKTSPGEAREEEKADQETEERGEAEETLAKTWNFRPRKPIQKKSSNGNGGPKTFPENDPRSPAGEGYAAGEKKAKKQKFSIYLSKMEIEEDIYAMTGSKPNRRPKKRLKTVQKQLDNVFPGLWLASITPELYKVHEAPQKV